MPKPTWTSDLFDESAETRTMTIEWLHTGGPLVCGAMNIASQWRGIEGSSIGGRQADHKRACNVGDYLGKVMCGPAELLVFPDEPLGSAFYRANEHAVAVARWWSSESAERAERALCRLPSSLPLLAAPMRLIVNGPLIMFDSAEAGIRPRNFRVATIAPGEYSVTSELYDAPDVFRFSIHRFLRQ